MVICWGMVNMAFCFTHKKKVVLPDLNAKIIGISRKIHLRWRFYLGKSARHGKGLQLEKKWGSVGNLAAIHLAVGDGFYHHQSGDDWGMDWDSHVIAYIIYIYNVVRPS